MSWVQRWHVGRVSLAVAVAVAGVAGVALGAAQGEDGWRSEGTSPLARTEVGSARAGGFIWVVGGFGTGAAPSAEVERYDPRERTWELMPSLPVTLNHAGVFGWRGRPYVFGGFVDVPLTGPGESSNRLFRFDGRERGWTELEPAPAGRSAFAIGRIGRRVYVAGGAVEDAQSSARLDVYDLKRGRWREGPAMDVAREHLAGAVAGKPGKRYFYAIGGRDFYGSANYRTVERFNPRTGRWRRMADTGTAHGGFGAVGVGRRVVALGGEAPGSSPAGTIAAAEIYSPRRDRWRSLPDMPTARHGLGVAVSGRRVYAIEGGTVTLLGISNAVESLRVGR